MQTLIFNYSSISFYQSQLKYSGRLQRSHRQKLFCMSNKEIPQTVFRWMTKVPWCRMEELEWLIQSDLYLCLLSVCSLAQMFFFQKSIASLPMGTATQYRRYGPNVATDTGCIILKWWHLWITHSSNRHVCYNVLCESTVFTSRILKFCYRPKHSDTSKASLIKTSDCSSEGRVSYF